jgi:tetratricopeptide (TPR) repeat protein
LTTSPHFSTNPYTESMQKLKTQGKLAAKVTGYTLLSVTTATALIWQSYHLYIEHFLSRSPGSLNYKARLLLHGAYFREHIVPDYGMAAVYLEEVLRVALEEQHLDESHPDIVGLRLRLAYDEWHAGNLFDAITQYTRAWATMTESGDQDTLITTAKQLGDLYTRVGDLEKAEEYLTWAFYAVIKDNDVYRKINVLCSLASLYAVQRQFHLALPLFLQALQAIPQDDDQQWLCTKAILQNQLSETFYGMGKSDEAMGWAQAALASSSDGMAKYEDAKDCRECGGVVSNNLGKLLEVTIHKGRERGGLIRLCI